MKIVFLGTGASEGIPSIFCNCKVCSYARKVGGHEKRSRMGMLIDDDLLLDCSPDLRTEIDKANVNLKNVYNVIITHSHGDHLSVEDLLPQICFINGGSDHHINVYGNDVVIDKINEELKKYQIEDIHITTNKICLNKKINIGDYYITPILAQHMKTENSFYYLVEKGGKKYLHLCDGGEFYDASINFLKEIAQNCDLIVYDMTFGLCEERFFGHCNLNQVVERINKFKELGIVGKNTRNIATHFAHWAGTHLELKEKLEEYEIEAAYDGMSIEI